MTLRLLLVLLAFAAWPLPAVAAEPTLVTTLTLPIGLALDADGDIWVASDAVTSALLSEISPTGELKRQISHGGMASIGEGKALEADASGLIVVLNAAGIVSVLDPVAATLSPWFDLRALDVDTSAMYDVESSSIVGSSLVTTQDAFYGDLALWRPDDTLDLFVSGVSVAVPFVERVRIGAEGPGSAKVLATSIGIDAPVFNSPRGVAVSADGTVVTALPGLARFGGEHVEFAVAFGGLYDQGIGAAPAKVLGGHAFTTADMTADSAGRFLAVIGAASTAPCASVPALMVIEADLETSSCTTLGELLDQPSDVTVTADGATRYVTMRDSGQVLALRP